MSARNAAMKSPSSVMAAARRWRANAAPSCLRSCRWIRRSASSPTRAGRACSRHRTRRGGGHTFSWRAARRGHWRAGRAIAAAYFLKSWWRRVHEHQGGPLDPAHGGGAGVIEPFEPGQVRDAGAGRIVSYGTSSYGYDVRCAREFKIFTNINSTIVDPKAFDPQSFVDVESDVCIIPPNSFALARTVEFFRIPRDTLVVCLGKSTYARCGIIVNVTPLEPEWEGHVTLEFSNTTPLPAKIYAGEGVAQMLFFQSDEVCETSYKDRGGKYQGQTGVTLPRT